jgi:acetyl esterase
VNQLGAHAAAPVYMLTPAAAREGLVELQRGSESSHAVEIEDRSILVEGRPVLSRIVRPADAASSHVALYLHGAGWVMGDFHTHGRLAVELAVGSKVTIVFLEYDRAPEAQYPVAIEQAYAAACCIAESEKSRGLNTTKLALVGDSSGGNMAAAVTILSILRRGPGIAGQVLLYPAMSSRMDTLSYKAYAEGPWLTRKAMEWFWDQYLPDKQKRSEPTASPLLASSDLLKAFPPTLVVTAEHDVLRDEGEAFARKLMSAGVESVSTRYNGAIHDFMLLNAVSRSNTARAALGQATQFLRWVFDKCL